MAQKFPPLKTVDLKVFRKILLSNRHYNHRFSPKELMIPLKIDAIEADTIAREAAKAGYLGWIDGGWQIMSLGRRLCVDKMRKPISRAKADEILQNLLQRVEEFNSEDGHLICISQLDVFGSFLDSSKQELGDLDVSFKFDRRTLDNKEHLRTEEEITRVLPRKYQQCVIMSFGCEAYDRNLAQKRLKAGLTGLSLTDEDVAQIGFPYMSVYTQKDGDGYIIPPSERKIKNAKMIGKLVITDEKKGDNLPVVTARVPDFLPKDNVLISTDDIHLSSRDLDRVTAAAYHPESSDCTIPSMQFAGAHHLCPAWKKDLGGVAMLREIFDWAIDRDLMSSRDVPNTIEISFNGRDSSVFLAGETGKKDNSGPYVPLSGDIPDYTVIRYTGHMGERIPSITRNQVAYEWAISQALRKCAQELCLKGAFVGKMSFVLHALFENGTEQLPDMSGFVPLATDILEQSEWIWSGASDIEMAYVPEDGIAAPLLRVEFSGDDMRKSQSVMDRISNKFLSRKSDLETFFKETGCLEVFDFFKGRNRKNQTIAPELPDFETIRRKRFAR